MKLVEKQQLTFNDVFLYQNISELTSRSACNISPREKNLKNMLSSKTPFIASNMNAVSGKRMAEAIAIYGGLACLPQDMSSSRKEEILNFLNSTSNRLIAPVCVASGEEKIIVAKYLAMKKSFNAVFVIDEEDKIIGYYTSQDLDKMPESETLDIKKFPYRTLEVEDHKFSKEKLSSYYDKMVKKGVNFLVFESGMENKYEVLTKEHAIRYEDYPSSLNANNNLDVILTYGVNQILKDEEALKDMLFFYEKYKVKQFIIDTAHGTQQSMVEALKKTREYFKAYKNIILIAGNVSTAEGTRMLLDAGADGVKVGIGPGAMCETRMQTAVGRPQFSAVVECAEEAIKTGNWVIADGGIKHPRDVCLALAAGVSYVMLGTILAGTLESAAEMKYDVDGKPYKQNFGMASGYAVQERNKHLSPFEQAKKMRYQEGISTSTIYLKKDMMTVGDVIDKFTTGLKSSMSYIGAKNLKEFNEKAVIAIQSSSGYVEGTPHGRVA